MGGEYHGIVGQKMPELEPLILVRRKPSKAGVGVGSNLTKVYLVTDRGLESGSPGSYPELFPLFKGTRLLG